MNIDDTHQIHEASLELLRDPGIRIDHEGIQHLLLNNGASAGASSGILKLPKTLVEECLQLCPRQFSLTDREGKELLQTSTAGPWHWSCPGLSIQERDGHRPITTMELEAWARLLDQLDQVHVIFGTALKDVPPKAQDAAGLRCIAMNSRKHIRVLCSSPAGAELLTQIKPVVGAHPWFSIGFTAHGPLRWTELALEIYKRTAGHGIPVTVNGEPMAGVSGPVTLAGAAAVGNAEILAGLVINQLLEPGRPCIYNLGLAHIFDMKTSIAVTGAPENALFAKISALMGWFYHLPSASWVSTESMCPDGQAALEKMFGFQTHAADGVTNIWGFGQLESEMTISPAQAVIDNEIIGYAARYRRGVEFSADTLALDVSRDVGIGGSFLEHDHTFQHFRSEFFQPGVLFRQRRTDWNNAGRPRLDQRAEDIAVGLMKNEVENGLSAEHILAMNKLVDGFIQKSR